MATDTARAVLDDAWGHIPHSRETTEGLRTFTRGRIERVIHLVVGFGSLALGGQAFVAALTGESGELPGWHEPLLIVTFVPLLLMIIACAVGRGVRITAGVFAVIFPLVLATWPIAVGGAELPVQSEPWIFYLVNVGTVATVLVFPLWLQVTWTVLTPLLFGIARLIQGGFAPGLWINVSLDVSFSLILGGVLITLAWLFRAMADNVDQTRARAVESYSAAAAASASEQERVAVAGLMHDSVLAALIAASRADSLRERQLAVQMAREALTRLANADSAAEEGSDVPVAAAAMVHDLERAAADLGVVLRVERDGIDSAPPIPGRIAHAIVLAATQAMANSVQHADAKGLHVALAHVGRGVRVVIRDRGAGFDLAAIAPDRLGIRGSILARLDAVGGTAQVESTNAGTTVTLIWEESV